MRLNHQVQHGSEVLILRMMVPGPLPLPDFILISHQHMISYVLLGLGVLDLYVNTHWKQRRNKPELGFLINSEPGSTQKEKQWILHVFLFILESEQLLNTGPLDKVFLSGRTFSVSHSYNLSWRLSQHFSSFRRWRLWFFLFCNFHTLYKLYNLQISLPEIKIIKH